MSEVVTAIARNRAEVLAREEAAMRRMARQYRRVVRDTTRRAQALADQIARLRAAGEEVSLGRLVRLERYQLMLAQLGADVDAYAIRVALPELEALQADDVWLAQEHAERVERVLLGTERAGRLQAAFVLSPSPALEALVGVMGDGGPVREYLRQSMTAKAVQAVEDAVARVVTGNLGPREAARLLVTEAGKASGVGLDRALCVTRTESLRAYREAQRGRWADSGVVQAYRRTAAQDERTCLGCIVLDGSVWPITEPLEDHPNGRCAMVPVFIVGGQVISSWGDAPSARDWLAGAGEETQLAVMGPGRYAAWKRGDVALEDMARRVEDPTGRFGGAWVPRTVADIQATGAAGGRAGRAAVVA